MASLLLATTVGGYGVIHSNNIGSQSVSYATSAGSAGSASSAGYSDEAKWISYPDGPRDLSDRSPIWNNRSVAWDFVGAATANGSGTYGGVMTFVPWDGTSASTGDSSYQLAFANTTGVNASGQPKLSIRNGINSTWNAWYTLIHSGNIGSQSVSYATSAGSAGSVQGYSAYSLIEGARGTHSGSDFPNGTLVTTDIPAQEWAGDSFVMEVSGKSYDAGNSPFKLIMQGYLYADTVINVSAMSYGSYFPSPVKVMNLDGNLAFWWPRGSYWNSFEVHVRDAGGSSGNRVTGIGNSVDPPEATKKVSCTPIQVIHTNNIGSQSVNYATSAGSATTATTAGSLTSMNISQFTNNSGYITSVGNITRLWAESHPTDYYVRANWTGSYWQLTSNHPSPVQVGYADNAGNSATTSQRDFSGDISTSGMGRFAGWYTGNAQTGLAAEIGTSGGQVYIIAYNRQTSAYGTLNLESTDTNLRISGSTVNVTSGTLQQGGNAVIHAGNIASQSVASATDASTLGGFGRGNTTNKVAYFDGDRNLYVNNPETYTGEVRLGAAWGRGGVYASGTLSLSTSGTQTHFVFGNSVPIIAYSTGQIDLGGSSNYPIDISGAAHKYIQINPGNGYEAMVRYIGGSGSSWYVGKRTSAELVGTQSFHFYSDAAVQTVGGINPSGDMIVIGSYQLNNGFSISKGSDNYGVFNSWVRLDGSYGFYSGTNSAHIYPNGGSYGSWKMDGTRNGWNGIEFGASNGNVSLMVNPSSNTTGFHNNAYGWQFFWESGTLYCFKNTYGAGTQATVLDSVNFTSYAPSLTGGGASGSWGISVTGTAGSAPNAGNINPFYNVTAGVGNGLRFWSGDDNYKISMGVGGLYQYGPVIDYSIKSQMDAGSTGRGFTWGNNGVTPVAALNATSGNFQVAGTIANGSIWINNGANYNSYNENIRLFNAPNGVSVIAFSASGTEGSPRTSLLGFSDRLETRVSDTWEQRIYGGYVEARGSFRAPIFYDSNDTGYYGDFAGFSRMSEIGVTNDYVYNYDSIESPRSVAEFGNVGKYVATRNAVGDYPSFSFEHVYGTHSWGQIARFHIRQSGADRPSIQFSSGSSNTRWNIGYCTGSDDNFRIVQNMGYRPDNSGVTDSWGTERFRINTDGSMYCLSSFTASGDVTAYSDIRVKENIEVIPDAIKKVKSIRGVTFTRTDNDDNKKYMGVIAQELLDVIPEVVSETDSGMYTVAYGNITALLIEAIKEQQAQIDELKAKLDGLTK